MAARDEVTIHYTRCPVPTATAIGLRTGVFEALYVDEVYRFRDIAELECEHADAHYTHAIDYIFREGGSAPPLWARSSGAESRLLGVTFMEELLGIYVRADDAVSSVAGLADRRVGLPVWRSLVFDFWRVAAVKGFHSALRRHGLRLSDVETLDIEEGPGAEGAGGGAGGRALRYRRQLEALLSHRVDAIFGKGAEAVLLEREAAGRIRLLYDLRCSPEIDDRVNNSTPRLVTAGARLVRDHPEAAVRYLQGVLRAAIWAPAHREEAAAIVARECGIAPSDVARCFGPEYTAMFWPSLAPEILATVETMKTFLLTHGYLARDFALDDWVAPAPLAEAMQREQSVALASISVPDAVHR